MTCENCEALAVQLAALELRVATLQKADAQYMAYCMKVVAEHAPATAAQEVIRSFVDDMTKVTRVLMSLSVEHPDVEADFDYLVTLINAAALRLASSLQPRK